MRGLKSWFTRLDRISGRVASGSSGARIEMTPSADSALRTKNVASGSSGAWIEITNSLCSSGIFPTSHPDLRVCGLWHLLVDNLRLRNVGLDQVDAEL